MVVQENNFHEMRDFVFLGKRFGVDTVYFSRLADWGTFSPEELHSRSIHRADHPRDRELLAAPSDHVLGDPVVCVGNLTDLRDEGVGSAEGTM